MIFCGFFHFHLQMDGYSIFKTISIAAKIEGNLPASFVIMNNIRRYMIVISQGHIIVTFGAFSFFDEITYFIANLSPSEQV